MKNIIQISVKDIRGVVVSYYRESPVTYVEDIGLMRMVNGILANPFDDYIEKLDLYYKEKLIRLRMIFDPTIQPYAIFHMPSADDMVWIQLKDPLNIESLSPLFQRMDTFGDNKNYLLDFTQPIDAIGLNFRTVTLEVFKLMFSIIKT